VDFDDFRAAVERAEKLSAAGDDRAAARALEELAASDLPALDRGLAWVQSAEARERAGELDAAQAAYDRAIALETPLLRFSAAFKKGDFLLRQGRREESRALFASLLERPEATLAERRSLESRLKLLRRPPAKKR
jgi:tetratricopeptide (TPR) repeat protein